MSDRPDVQWLTIDTLARLRVALGFVCAVLVFWLAEPTTTTMWLGTPVAVVGEALRIWAAGHLNKSREVTSSGPYRWTAHPLYLGSAIIGAGLAIASGRVVAAAIVAIYLALTLTAAIKSEEQFMRRVFGDQYEEYRHRGVADSERRFTFARARANREHRAAGGVVIAWLLLAWKATYNGSFWGAAGAHVVRPGG